MQSSGKRRLRILIASAASLTAVAFCMAGSQAIAQTIYREYDDGHVDVLPGYGPPGRRFLPARRPPPDDRDDEESDAELDDDGHRDRGQDEERYEAYRRESLNRDRAEPDRKAPVPPPSVDARPDEKAWKPAL